MIRLVLTIVFGSLVVFGIYTIYKEGKKGVKRMLQNDPCPFIDRCTRTVPEKEFRNLCLKALHQTCNTYEAYVLGEKKFPREWKKEIEE